MADERSFPQPITEERLHAILDERDQRLRERIRDDVMRADQARWKRVFATDATDEIAERAMSTPLEFANAPTLRDRRRAMEEAIRKAVADFEAVTGFRVEAVQTGRNWDVEGTEYGSVSVSTEVSL